MLSDKDLRARYDQFGEAGVKGQGAPNMQDFDLGDIFETFFGGQAGAGGAGRRRSGCDWGRHRRSVHLRRGDKLAPGARRLSAGILTIPE